LIKKQTNKTKQNKKLSRPSNSTRNLDATTMRRPYKLKDASSKTQPWMKKTKQITVKKKIKIAKHISTNGILLKTHITYLYAQYIYKIVFEARKKKKTSNQVISLKSINQLSSDCIKVHISIMLNYGFLEYGLRLLKIIMSSSCHHH